jgi:hypothetical protein
MGIKIACIQADAEGGKLWLKEFRIEKDRFFVKYRSTYNDIPFLETEIYILSDKQTVVITGDDGTILYRFHINWLNGLEI